jgi:hypothetical protein
LGFNVLYTNVHTFKFTGEEEMRHLGRKISLLSEQQNSLMAQLNDGVRDATQGGDQPGDIIVMGLVICISTLVICNILSEKF